MTSELTLKHEGREHARPSHSCRAAGAGTTPARSRGSEPADHGEGSRIIDGSSLYRIDHGLHTATVVGQGGVGVAADRQGHVFTTDLYSVLRYDIATGQMRRVVGVAGSEGVSLGALPASLNHPRALAVTDTGDLLIGNEGEHVVLRARFH